MLCRVQSAAALAPKPTSAHAVDLLNGKERLIPLGADRKVFLMQSGSYSVDSGDVRGQYLAKRALEAATAWGHHILM